jgi:predicted alpha/beta superfamily hydrolase
MSGMRRARDEGRIRIHERFASRYLAARRSLAVYLPPGYHESARRYPVLYLQDGQNLFDPATAFGGQDWGADVTADNMIGAGEIEPVILVGIYNTGVHRISEYTPTRDRRMRKGGKADRYAQMLAREIKPFIDRQYRTRKGPERTGVGGSSLGGLVSLLAGLLYPKVFGCVAVMSPSVWWDGRSILEIVRTRSTPAKPRVWLDTGTCESDAPRKVVDDARMLRDALLEKGWRMGTSLAYLECEGAGHSEAAWAARFGAVLSFFASGGRA